MSNEQKTAIQQAEKQLENERKEQLKREVYNYLKNELESIDSISERVRKLSEEKRAHEENIKNIKQGNLKAIEERRKTYTWMDMPNIIRVEVPYNPISFFSNTVAGTTITTSAGNTYLF